MGFAERFWHQRTGRESLSVCVYTSRARWRTASCCVRTAVVVLMQQQSIPRQPRVSLGRGAACSLAVGGSDGAITPHRCSCGAATVATPRLVCLPPLLRFCCLWFFFVGQSPPAAGKCHLPFICNQSPFRFVQFCSAKVLLAAKGLRTMRLIPLREAEAAQVWPLFSGDEPGMAKAQTPAVPANQPACSRGLLKK
jgi:hypothetical protein